MPSQRLILGTGLAILLIIGAASIGLNFKSQPDTAAVDRALAVLGRISDMRPLLRRAESAARGYALSGDPQFAAEYRESSARILPALDSLIEIVKANPGEKRLLEETRALQDSLTATRATNEALEAAAAERTAHLVTAQAELRHSAAGLQSTFNSMAEAVLVIDTKGEVLLSNPAAERMLRYRPGMTVELLRSLSTVFHADGVTPMPVHDMPASRALRGKEFHASEIFVPPVSGNPPVHLVISGRPLRDASGAITGAALVYHDITASRETEHKLLQAQGDLDPGVLLLTKPYRKSELARMIRRGLMG